MNNQTVLRVSGMNWQGGSFTYDLAPLTAIVGGNMKGKSRVPNALRVGLTGYSPAHGKRPGATFGFIGEPNGAIKGGVELAFSDGASVNRLTWEMRRGKIESGEARMDVKVPPVLLDLHEEFFKLSGPKRTDFIFSKMDMSKLGFAVEEITARLKKDVKVESPNAQTEAALADIVIDIEELDRERHELGQGYQEWIGQICEQIKAKADAALTTIDQMSGLIQGTTVLAGSSPVLAPFNPEDLKAARQTHADLTARKNNAASYGDTTARLKLQKAAYGDALKGAVDNGPGIKQAEDEIAALEKEIKKFKSGTVAAFDAQHKLACAKDEAGWALDAREKDVAERKAELAKDKKAKCCPKCKAKGKTWEKVLAMEAKEIEAEEKAIAADREKLKAQDEPIRLALLEHAAQQQRDADNQGRIESKARKEKRLNEMKLSQTTVKVSVPMPGQMIVVNTLTREAVAERIKSCAEQLAAPGVPPAPPESEITAARAKVESLEQLERAHAAQHADALRAEEGRAKHAEAAAVREVAVKAGAVMQALKAEMMDKAFAGFLEKVNRFCLGLFENNKQGVAYRDGEIGYLRGATWVSLDHFSGTEEMLTYLGLSIALAEESPCRIVFVDEWLRDSDMRSKVARRLCELQKGGHIDQVVVIDTETDGYADAGFKIVTI